MNGAVAQGVAPDSTVDSASYARAILNILGDFSEEKDRLQDTQKAILNVLEDAGAEKLMIAATQKAVLNILDDFSGEKARLADVQKAMLNILEDAGAEKLGLEATQKAALNILADFSDERAKLADVQKAVLNILEDFSGEKAQLESIQKAVLNILEDFDAEKNKVERINRDMAGEIAERERAEEALEAANKELEAANKELEAFSYSVSHDLRAPLRGIDGFSQILLEDYADRMDDRGRDYLRRLRGASQRMGFLIDDLLKLSRVTRAELSLEDVDLGALAQEVVEDLRRQEPGRSGQFDVAPGLTARADPRLLRVVLENLLSNAWKFTSRRPTARIELGAQNVGNERAFYVRDNGAGFDMAYADKLFGAFQRLHAASEFPGTGVGLATVQRVIHKHGGRIWAEAAIDRGATFFFTL